MRETPKSLRWYFILIGAFNAYMGLLMFGVGSTSTPMANAEEFHAVGAFNIVLGAVLIGTGMMVPKLLQSSPKTLHSVVWALFALKAFSAGVGPDGNSVMIIALGIASYLSFNVHRLSKQGEG